jgi:hypothetical protein
MNPALRVALAVAAMVVVALVVAALAEVLRV